MAMPLMKKYIEYNGDIYDIYLDYIDPRDIHVYSIVESFLDFTVEKENGDPDNHAMLLETENKWKENDRNWRKSKGFRQFFCSF